MTVEEVKDSSWADIVSALGLPMGKMEILDAVEDSDLSDLTDEDAEDSLEMSSLSSGEEQKNKEKKKKSEGGKEEAEGEGGGKKIPKIKNPAKRRLTATEKKSRRMSIMSKITVFSKPLEGNDQEPESRWDMEEKGEEEEVIEKSDTIDVKLAKSHISNMRLTTNMLLEFRKVFKTASLRAETLKHSDFKKLFPKVKTYRQEIKKYKKISPAISEKLFRVLNDENRLPIPYLFKSRQIPGDLLLYNIFKALLDTSPKYKNLLLYPSLKVSLFDLEKPVVVKSAGQHRKYENLFSSTIDLAIVDEVTAYNLYKSPPAHPSVNREDAEEEEGGPVEDGEDDEVLAEGCPFVLGILNREKKGLNWYKGENKIPVQVMLHLIAMKKRFNRDAYMIVTNVFKYEIYKIEGLRSEGYKIKHFASQSDGGNDSDDEDDTLFRCFKVKYSSRLMQDVFSRGESFNEFFTLILELLNKFAERTSPISQIHRMQKQRKRMKMEMKKEKKGKKKKKKKKKKR